MPPPWWPVAAAGLLALALAAGCAAPAGPSSSTAAGPALPPPSSTTPAPTPPPDRTPRTAASWDPACSGPAAPFVLRIMASAYDLDAGKTDAFAWVQEDGAVIDLQGRLIETDATGNGTTLQVLGPASAFGALTPAETCQRLFSDLSLPAPSTWRNLTYVVKETQRHRLHAADLANLTAILEEEFFDLPHDASQTECKGAGYGRWTVRAGGRVHDVLTECLDGNPHGDDEAAARLGELADRVGEILQRAN